jgi:hypothetical protein
MKAPRLLGLIVCLLALSLPTATATARRTHTYKVLISITADRSTHTISGRVTTEPPAPSFFCEQAPVRILEATPGKDKVLARTRPKLAQMTEWTYQVPPNLRGARLYAETSAYHLPGRPIECEAARSREVTAP